MNKIILGGRLTKDVDFKVTSSGTSIANFSIKCKNTDTNNGYIVMNCVLWGDKAEFLSNNTKKGSYLTLEGYLMNDKNEYNGKTYYNIKVVVEKFEVLTELKEEKMVSNEETSYTPQDSNNGVLDYDDGDLPF